MGCNGPHANALGCNDAPPPPPGGSSPDAGGQTNNGTAGYRYSAPDLGKAYCMIAPQAAPPGFTPQLTSCAPRAPQPSLDCSANSYIGYVTTRGHMLDLLGCDAQGALSMVGFLIPGPDVVEAGGDAVKIGTDVIGEVGYGSTGLSRAVQAQRLLDNNKLNSYASALLDDGTIITGRSAAGIHAEESLIAQANASGRSITDIYSELEPCANTCQALTQGMNVSWSWGWNGVDRVAARAAQRSSVWNLFGGG